MLQTIVKKVLPLVGTLLLFSGAALLWKEYADLKAEHLAFEEEMRAALASLEESKQDNLTIDTFPSPTSTNPVTSRGIQAAIAEIGSIPGNLADGEGMGAVVEGNLSQNKSTGAFSHAEGNNTIASSTGAHAEGSATQASAWASHAEGTNTLAESANQHVFGKYNVGDSTGTYAEIVGIGQFHDSRKNGRTLDWSGNERLAGSLTLGMGTSEETTITAAELQQIKSSAFSGELSLAEGPAPAEASLEKSDAISSLTWNAIGDSVTYVGRYLYCVQNTIGLNPTILGVPASCIAINNTYPDCQNSSMVEKILGLNGNEGYEDADVWTILGGINDVYYESPIGALAPIGSKFDNTTVYGALQSIVENILGRRNHPRLLLLTPYHTTADYANKGGATMPQIIKAIEDVGACYGVPVVNLTKLSGISKFNWFHPDYPTTFDGLHPTDVGAEMIAAPIVASLRMLLYEYMD